MSRPPYPHRCIGGDPFDWTCRCEATPDTYSAETARDGWGSGCRVAMELRIADLEHTANAAHDQLADIAALARGEMEPDVRSGGAPVLGEAWEAVKALRVRAERAEAERDAALLATDKAVAAALEARAKEIDAKADAAFDGAAMYGAPFSQGKGEAALARREAYRVAACIVRGAP